MSGSQYRNDRHRRMGSTALTLCLLAAILPAQADHGNEFTELSLDDLLEVEVFSVSRRPEPLGRAAAAIHVISGEEFRRSGARSIAEALRMVPGMNVARSSTDTYSISARGFQNTGDKLQVLLDGRSVYSPLASNVFWDVLETDLGSIDRIEVIRGPGATLWGANAVNGVINIITRSAANTPGGALQAAGGNEEIGSGTLRQATAAGNSGRARFYAKAYKRDPAANADGSDAIGGQRLVQGGARGDWTLSDTQQLSIYGDLYSAESLARGNPSPTVDTDLSGGNINAHWSLDTASGKVSALLSLDHYHRDVPEVFSDRRDTYDLSVQHEITLGAAHQLTYGVGYRNSRDQTGGPPRQLIFLPSERVIDVVSGFIQDQIHLSDTLTWTIGTKLEHNDFSGTELQPGTRLGWVFDPEWFTWAAVSRAVRTPNRLDHDVALFCPPAGIEGFCTGGETLPIGSRDFDSEELVAYEWGLRYAYGQQWSADLAVFYNDYRNLRSTETGGGGIRLQNLLEGRGTGAELSLSWHPADDLDLIGSYSFLELDINAKPESTDTNSAPTTEGGSPRHQAGLRVYYRPWEDWSTDGFLRYVGKLDRTANPGSTGADTSVPAYTELSLRIAYRLRDNLELTLTGENLLHDQHPEYGSSATRSELQRSGQLGLVWSWQ